MPTNPRSIILEDLQSLENYMYNLNGTHLLDLEPPHQLDAIEQEKWVKKQARYRQRKNSSIASGCGDSNYCTTDSTSQLKTTQQQHEDLLNKNPQLPTFQSIQINQKNLQGGDNLLQHRCKRKTPPSDAAEVKSNKKRLVLCIYNTFLHV